MHDYSSTLCHRDVKSFNFLVDSQLNTKIADLELGGNDIEDPNYLSTAENNYTFGKSTNRNSFRKSSSNLGIGDDSESDFSTNSSGDNFVRPRTSVRSGKSSGKSSIKSRSSKSSGLKRVTRKLFGSVEKDEEFLCTWQAPEVMIGAPHSQSSDIYSLGLVLWEIISGLVPFENTNSQEDVRSLVLSGKRPEIPPCTDSRYVSLIKNCWKADYSGRPSIKSIVSILTMCWESSVHRYLFATSYVCNVKEVRKQYESELDRLSFTNSTHGSGRHPEDYLNRRASLGRTPLSPEAVKAVAYLQNEPRLQTLQALSEAEKCAFVIMTPTSPHLVLWISKNIPKMLGYFYSDLVCGDLNGICGPSTNRFYLRTLMQEGGEGKCGHGLFSFYRRDGSQFITSLHVFPIFAIPEGEGQQDVTLTLDNSFLLNASFEESASPLPSPIPENGYMDAITRSLEAARISTSEGKEFSPLRSSKKIPRSKDDRAALKGAPSEHAQTEMDLNDTSMKIAPVRSAINIPTVKTQPNDSGTPIQHATDSPMELTMDFSHDFLDEKPTTVAYIVLQFNVIQDSRRA